MLLTHLHDQNIEKINKLGRAKFSALKLFAYLESNPISEINKTAQDLQLSFNTILSAVVRLLDLKILVQSDGNLRDRRFSYKECLDILKEGT